MKVRIGNYRSNFICNLHQWHMERKYGFNFPENKDWEDDLLEKLDDSLQWVLDNTLNKIKPQDRVEKIVIEHFDTYSMDNTLAPIILPMLKQLKATKHGAPLVSNDDVPPELKREEGADEYEVDSNFFIRWDYVLNEMIWAFDTVNKHNTYELTKQERDRMQNGFELFGKYYQNLWD